LVTHYEIFVLMRVLMVVPQYPYPIVGGLEKQSHELSKALVAEGIDVQVLSGKILQDQRDHEIVDGVLVKRIPWSKDKLIRFVRAPFDILFALWFQRHSFDVIHLHQHSWVGLYVIIVAKLLGKPILTKLPNVGDLGLPGLRKKLLGWLRQRVLLQSDALIAMSAESLTELMNVGYPTERVLITPNGIALKKISMSLLSEKKRFDLCKVVFVGRLSEEKQLSALLNAWADVCKDNMHDAMLQIWGEGPLEYKLKQECTNLGISSRVTFCGHVKGVTNRLLEMDIFVLPSKAEGNSNAILEAMVAGLPIVSTPVGGTPMLVGEDGRPFLCSPGDSEALCSILLQLIKDRNLRISIGMAMRQRVEQYFDICHVAETYIKAYGLLAAKQRSRICDVGNPVVMEEK